MDDATLANRAHWEDLAPLHQASDFYDVPGFLAGRCTLGRLDVEALGDVTGRSLLHLQCHFGLDTLSWARRGARVTGVDFSPTALAQAEELARRSGLEARFVCSDVHTLPDVLEGRFDVVYTSGGVLAWLRDLARWAEVVAHFLRPGGVFLLSEIHPFTWCIDDHDTELRFGYGYFPRATPWRFEDDGSYAAPSARVANRVTYEWPHPLGEIVTCLTAAGLRIESLQEYPFCCYQMLPFMTQGEDGYWRLPPDLPSVPFHFTLRATR